MEVIKKRFIWADVLRILAIYLVIVVHSFPSANFSRDLTTSWPFIISFTIAKTCVPLFVMLSGALLLGKTETYKLFFKKRIGKVLIPWVIWTLIYMFWNYNVNHYAASTIPQWKYFFELTFLSQLWFLPLIFSLYLMTPLLRLITAKFKKNRPNLLDLSLVYLGFGFAIFTPKSCFSRNSNGIIILSYLLLRIFFLRIYSN